MHDHYALTCLSFLTVIAVSFARLTSEAVMTWSPEFDRDLLILTAEVEALQREEEDMEASMPTQKANPERHHGSSIQTMSPGSSSIGSEGAEMRQVSPGGPVKAIDFQSSEGRTQVE